MELEIPTCPNCKYDLVEADTKTGGKYYRCPNWKPRDMGCKGFQWFPPRGGESKPQPKADTSAGERIAKVLEDNLPDIARNTESILDELKRRERNI